MFAIIVPRIVVPEAILTKPSTFQKTLHAKAPFIKLTLALAFVENAPSIWIIKTALEFPWASSVNPKFKVAGLGIE